MDKVIRLVSAGLLAAGMMTAAPALAQQGNAPDKKKVEEDIVIRKKGEASEKMTIVIEGDKVTINGKPADDYKGENVTVLRRKIMEPHNYNFGQLDLLKVSGMGNRAVLGVVTEQAEGGVKINEITKGSGAEKAGLKVGDVISGVNDKKIASPDDLVKAIGAFKPEEKVTIQYKRDGKDATASATLGKREMDTVKYFNVAPGLEERIVLGRPSHDQFRAFTVPGYPRTPGTFSWSATDRPKLGVSVQDTEEGKGVKVIDVDEGSAAETAGVKEGDVILSFDGKDVNDAMELAKLVAGSKDKKVIALKINRNGKTVNAEVKVPRKLKTADL